VAAAVVDNVKNAFDEFDWRWAEEHGVFRTAHPSWQLERVVIAGYDASAVEVARRRGCRSRCGR
jgi:hypothetical protein